MAPLTLDQFMRRWNDGTGALAVRGGNIALSETRLKLDGKSPDAGFVQDLSSLGDRDFSAVVAKMDDRAILAYLYNKYPAFFAKYDNGHRDSADVKVLGLHLKVQSSGKALDGEIDPNEKAAGGGLGQLLDDLDATIKSPRDRRLLLQVKLMTDRYDAKTLRNHVARTVDGSSPLAAALTPPQAQSAAQACTAAADTREGHSTQQSYYNCGLESWRIVINAVRAKAGEPPVSEAEFLKFASDKGYASDTGVTGADRVVKVLAAYGISAHAQVTSVALLRTAIRMGCAISVRVDPELWWDESTSKGHFILVTGIERDEETGKITGYFVNDTGTGECGKLVAAAKLEDSLSAGRNTVVTDEPVW